MLGAAAGKITAPRTHVGQKDRVADKNGIADDVGRVGRGMSWRMQDGGRHVADGKLLVVVKQMVKLGAVQLGVVLGLKNGHPGGDDSQDMLADGYFPP